MLARARGSSQRWDEPLDALPPRCARCDAFLRPDVVWFEELLPDAALAAAEDAARECDVLLVAGTSAEVYPAAALPETARGAGACVVEVNVEPTPLTPYADYALRGAAGVVLPRTRARCVVGPAIAAQLNELTTLPRVTSGGAVDPLR